MEKLILGLDPGKSGAIAVWASFELITFRLTETEADARDFLRQYDDGYAFIERVHSMPKQGVASSFKFGQSYGFLRGLLVGLQIPFEEVTPQKWQKEMGCLSHGDKRVTRARAQQLFPHLKVVHATADALLICEYGRRVIQTRNGT